MISKAKLHYLKIAPRKVRLVADLVRGKNFEKAQNILAFTVKGAVDPILKLLNQAFANAKDNYPSVRADNLKITKIIVDEGPVLKRRLPRARGRADIIRKRTSHVEIVLDEINKEVKDTTKKKKASKKKKNKKAKKDTQEKKPEKTKREKKNKKKRKKKLREDFSKTKKSLSGKKENRIFNKKAF